MRQFILILTSSILLILVIILGQSKPNDDDDVQISLENAYFEGQHDALIGDTRIKKTIDGCWVWTKSPWDSGRTPMFNPNIICDEK